VILGPAARVALYYAPDPDDPLAAAAAAWFAAHPQVTADARGYGFHATLKPPMRLRAGAGWADIRAAAAAIAASVPPFPLPPLAVADIRGFLALRETAPSPALQAFADACVAGADHLRAPPDAAELARRRRAAATPAEAANLARWGYPFVFATWFFHMTLTRRLDAAERDALLPAAAAHFAPALARPRQVAALSLFVQAGAGEAFALAERVALRG
jgi:hypothetical protein